MIRLYDDQQELIDCIRNAMRKCKSILIQAATGSGKTIVTSFIFSNATDKGKRVLMVVPRRELMEQTSNTFKSMGIEHSFITAGKPYNPSVLCWIATTETLARRLETAPDIDLLVFDEVHFGSTSNEKIINYYKNLGSYILGLSATPCKTSGKGLGCWFDDMVCGKSVKWLIDNKRLSGFRLFAPNTPDLSGIKTVAGDYAKGQLNDVMENDRVLVGNAVKHYKKHAFGKISVTFCTSRKHAEITNQAFIDAGVPSACVDGLTKPEERKRIFKALAMREILNVCNCDLLTFGFDLSSAAGMDVTVESISILRPTKSLALYSQIVGRALRYKIDPALIFDHAGNTAIHGLPDEPREWTLEDQTKQSRAASVAAIAIRQCEKCDCVHRPAPICPECGYVYPDGGRSIKEIEGELAEIKASNIEKAKLDKKRRLKACKTLDDYTEFGIKEGYSNPSGWARIKMKFKMKYAKRYGR